MFGSWGARCPFCEVRTLLPPCSRLARSPSIVQQHFNSYATLTGQRKRLSPINSYRSDNLATRTTHFDEANLRNRASGRATGLRRNSRGEQRTASRATLSRRVAHSKSEPKPRSTEPFNYLNRTNAPPELVGAREARHSRASTNSAGSRRKQRTKSKTDMFHALKMQETLHSISYEKRSQVKDQMQEFESFEDFPLLPVVRDSIGPQGLHGMTDLLPSPVQKVAIPALLGILGGKRRKKHKDGEGDKPKAEQFLIAAETGSGKTLAYLLPTLDAMKRNEIAEKEQKAVEEERKAIEQVKREANTMFDVEPPPKEVIEKDIARPRVIILVPTAELASQVGAVVKSFSHTIKYRAAVISSAITPTVIRNRVFNPNGIDVLVSTPHLLHSITEDSPAILSRVSHLILDEADSLLDRSFSELTAPIISRSMPSLKQLIFCSATIPKSLDNHLRSNFPDINRLVTPNLHAIPRRVQLAVVDCMLDPYRGNKLLACADQIYSIARSTTAFEDHDAGPAAKGGHEPARIIVFVNERETATGVADFLLKKGIDAIPLTRDTEASRKESVLASFRASAASSEGPNRPASRAKGVRDINAKVIVCTDLGSRGIDTVACRNVILYDVPHTTIDFIHRLGRTGRMNRRGRGIVLVGRGDRRDIIKEVRQAMFMGKAMI
jgi:ATP-dependent RNA helicase MRH4, mitochondrial